MRVYRVESAAEAAQAYPCITEDSRWAAGLPLSREWFAQNLGEHVWAWHAEEDGKVVGHIYWAPAERDLVPYRVEDGAAFLYCEWVQGPYQGRGIMRALFSAFVEGLRAEGYKGIVVDVTEYPNYMHYSHFAKRGFRVLREGEGWKLMYLPLFQATVEVEPLEVHIPRFGTAPVEIVILGSRFCPVGAWTVLEVRKVASEFPGEVELREIPASSENLARYGRADGIFINGKEPFIGPTSEEAIRTAIREALERG